MRYIYQVKRAPRSSSSKAGQWRYNMHRRECSNPVSGLGCSVALCDHDHITVDGARCCETIQADMFKAFGAKWAPSFPPPGGGLIENLPNVELSPFYDDGNVAVGGSPSIMVLQPREPDDIANVKAAIADHVAASVAEAEPAADKIETVNHPAHYNALGACCLGCGRPIECIDVIEHMTLNVGNAVKYVWRKDHKGSPIEDLEKAGWYIQREIQRLEREDSSRARE